jgi:succinate dehydrogenase/fumarate reductase-like Fe-S protein
MKTNHDGTVTLNAYDTWTSCGACGQRVTGDSIHTCSPQLKELTDEEIIAVGNAVVNHIDSNEGWIEFARAILRKAQEK